MSLENDIHAGHKRFKIPATSFLHANLFTPCGELCEVFKRVSCIVTTGISMHKGYAFVQFTNPFDARSACLGEDGRTVLSQILGE